MEDIVSYLSATGWTQDGDWRGASVWRHSGDYQVLVPARDGMGDGDRRVREILRCLSSLEQRAETEIAQEIASPLLDRQFFRTFPVAHESGYTSLSSGVQTILGVQKILGLAARTVAQGPHFAFAGRRPRAVGDILQAVELGPSRAGSYVVEVRLATELTVRTSSGVEVSGRAVLVQALEAATMARTAALDDDPVTLEQAVLAGVSAELCLALSDLSGVGRKEPFEITFQWARARPADHPADVVSFPQESGRLLQAAATRLKGLNAFGPASVSGLIEGLHDDANGDDRWRIKVRGELRTDRSEGPRRAVWVRLAGQAEYDRAMSAHRDRRTIHVSGDLSSATGRVELIPGPDITL
ncbi:hypothetical protein [Kineosporia sp. NBRC 101677]|uniref:hypothetical protein n=1 Tax=Kineosporia sp. NBRC 101677 TaxID=3032197 RepID=UPI0025564413|nr:hypothetical protein [Kineosporia sp. NBRC 101677]